MATVRIDPKNKIFLTIFAIIIIGTIGFFIASIFIKNDDDDQNDTILKIKFQKRSKFSISLKEEEGKASKSDDNNGTRYVIEVYNDEKLLQIINLGTDFGERNAIEVKQVKNDEWIVRSSSSDDEILFNIESDDEDFSSVYVQRSFKRKSAIVTDCLSLKSQNWYGGPEQMDQRYPIQKFNFSNYAYITKELESAAIMERYWFSSNGFFILLDYQNPLFIDQNGEAFKDQICFTGKKALPYDIHTDGFVFNYRIGAGSNTKVTHLNVINKFLGKPTGQPDERLIKYPIWNTWVRYGRAINQNTVRNFADEIIAHGFNHSLIDIDDFWEVCYGSMTVNPTNFSDLRTLTTELKQKGFVVGMWVHPFVNKNCQPYYDDAKSKNILVKSRSGSLDTSWWNSGTNEAAHYDFTNPDGKAWFKSKLEFIRSNFGIDVFKFDAGETSWYPEDPVLQGDSALSPSQITRAFVNMASEFGNLLETRTGWGSQHLPHLVRMLDFDSRWTVFNGLKSLIPTLIQFNLNGYVFVLPDMIGGNQYGNDVITKELFIRWLQASVFMPSLQFSVAPWDFKDKETIEISLKYTKLHFEYSELILERFKLAVEEGHPVNSPIWWLDPEDEVAQVVDDEFLLGETILAAPVVEQSKTQRDIYLPVGKWRDPRTGETHEGKKWIKNYPSPLDVLPYFIKED